VRSCIAESLFGKVKNVFYLLEVIFAAMRKLYTLLVKTIKDTHIPQKVVDKILKLFFIIKPTGQEPD